MDLMWIILSANSRLVRDQPGREEFRFKRRNLTKYTKLKEPRPCRARRLRDPSEQPLRVRQPMLGDVLDQRRAKNPLE